MTFDRRTFLRGGMALGFGSWVWGRGDRSLAAPEGQRLALLVGVGTGAGGLEPLRGCETDVARMAEVLQCRYGFLGSDVVTLTQSQGTLAQITATFDGHLRQRVQKGDRVLVYFSGYGVYEPPSGTNPALTWEQAIPYLGLLPAEAVTDGASPSDVQGDRPGYLGLGTLIGWLQGLKTKQITLILDCGFAPAASPLQGNLRSRSAGALADPPPLAIANGQLPPKFPLGPVTLISGAAPGQTAVEGQLGGSTSGLFSYGLAQSLWQSTGADFLAGLWHHSRLLLVPRLGIQQLPQWQSPNNFLDFPPPRADVPPGEGGALSRSLGTALQSHLGGVAPLVKAQALLHSYYQATAMAPAIPLAPPPLWQVNQIKGQTVNLLPLPPTNADQARENAKGTLREIYRAMPKSLALTVALGNDLERIERVDATSAFGALSQRSPTRCALVEGVINAGEGPADCVFGKLDTHRYTLFSEGGALLQPLTTSESSGAIKTVVSSLEPSLNRLLALKWLTLLVNGDSTGLGVQVSLTQATSGDNPLPRSLYEWRSPRFPQARSSANGELSPGVPSAPPDFLPTVTPNQTLACQLENLGDETLYGCLLGIDNRNLGIAGIFDPQLQLLKPQQRLTLPRSEDPHWSVSGETGIAQWFWVLSRHPLPSTVAALSQQVTSNNSPTATLPSRLLVLKNPLAVVLALVADLASHPPINVTVPDDLTLWDTADWLTLPIMYQVR